MSGNCPHRVIEIYTGPRGDRGPTGLSGSAGPSLPFSYTTGSTFSTTSSIEITGSLTISGSNTFKNIGPAIFSGSVNISSSLYVLGNTSGSFTGSFLGTASYANNANTASYLLNSTPPFPYTGSAVITGSLKNIGPFYNTGSININVNNSNTLDGLFITNTLNTAGAYAGISFTTDGIAGGFVGGTSTSNTYIGASSLALYAQAPIRLFTDANAPIVFSTNAIRRMQILGTGAVNILYSATVSSSLSVTGSFTVLATGSDLVNIGNATTSSQRLVRIGQDTAWIDLGSYISNGALAAIYLKQSSPDANNYTMWSDGVTLNINAPSITANVNINIANAVTPIAIKKRSIIFTATDTGEAVIPFIFNVGTKTSQTAGTSFPSFQVVGANKTWATGNISNQYWNYFTGNTASFTSSSLITNSYGLYVEAATVGANATITNNYAAGFSGNVTSTGFYKAGTYVYAETDYRIAGVVSMDYTSTFLRLGTGGFWTKIYMMQNIYFPDKNIEFSTITGSNLGTSISQKLGIWGVTPISQPTSSTYIDILLSDVGLRAIGGTANFSSSVTSSGIQINSSSYNSTGSTIDSGSTNFYYQTTQSFNSSFFEYYIMSGSNARAGNIMSLWSGSSIVYTETTTNDIGLTNNFSMSVYISGSNAVLKTDTDTNGWVLKAIIRSI